MANKEKQAENKEKIGIGAWLALIVLILVLSGAFRTAEGPIKVTQVRTSSARAAPARRTASWQAST